MKNTHDGRSTTFAPMLAKCLCAGLAVILSQPLLAQTGYPAKPIRIVSPFATGGTNDYLARMMGRVLTDAWGRAVVIENRPGAGGNIGTEAVARSPGDGYTLLMGSVTTHAINPVLYAKLPFNAEHDFAPVSGVAATQIVLTVHPSVPARIARDLLGLAKSRPQQLQYGSAGSGSISHMATELLSYTSGMRFQHVPYKGEGQAALDVISGQIDFMFANIPSVLGMVRAGKLRAIAVGGTTRTPMMPAVPTVAESGVPGYEMTGWFGLFSPAGVPRDILVQLNTEINRGLQSPAIKDILAQQGADPLQGSVDQYAAFVRNELAKWAKVVAAAGLKVE